MIQFYRESPLSGIEDWLSGLAGEANGKNPSNLLAEIVANPMPPFFRMLIWVSFALALYYLVASVFYSLRSWMGRGKFSFFRRDPQSQDTDSEKIATGSDSRIEAFAKWCLALAIRIGIIGYLALIGLLLKEPAQSLFGSGVPVIGSQWLDGLLFVALLFAGVIGALWLGHPVRYLSRDRNTSVRYAGRRAFEKTFGMLVPASGLLFAIGIIPLIVGVVNVKLSGTGIESFLGIAAGAGGAFWGHLQQRGKGGGGGKFILIASSILFVYGFALLGYHLSLIYVISGSWWQAGFWGAVFIAFVSGHFANLNYISLHRYYRDRLMEAFLPDYERVEKGESGSAGLADRLRLSEVWWDNANGPFLIINTNAVLVNSKTRKYRMRGGDNFILTPHYTGSNATGWQLTKPYMKNQMTLVSAMATSGAAANPNAGVGGRGATRNRAVSLVMALLGFRLGYWVRRPRLKIPKILPSRASHFYPSALYASGLRGYREDANHLELSDGGHFENLALYELVRRRCGLIIVCDGGMDTDASYSDFVSAIQRIEQDFGARIRFIEGDGKGGKASNMNRFGPELLVPHRTKGYPKDAEYAAQGYFVATIEYGGRAKQGPWPKTGILIYMKTTMIDKVSMKAKGYKGANPKFPDQTTADQFFDEEQFEAYRELGYRIAEQAVDDLKLNGALRKKVNLDPASLDKFLTKARSAARANQTAFQNIVLP